MNYLFFGNVARLTEKQFEDLFKLRSTVQLTKIDEDLAAQIVQNSEITLQKFKVFNIAAWITFIGFIISIITVIIIASL